MAMILSVEIYGDYDDSCTLCSSPVTVLLHVAALPSVFLVTVLVQVLTTCSNLVSNLS